MISDKDWTRIRAIFEEGFNSCFHFAMATVNEDGSPNVTPIGSLILKDNPSGFYLEKFPIKTRENLIGNSRVCILAVNAHKTFWGKSLMQGKFDLPPAVRLLGVAGKLREAGIDEIEEWQKKVAFARPLKGYKLMWSNMDRARDINFDSFRTVDIGEMTSGLW
jgi:uncharacterized protein